jgi:hypothetical protein
VGTLSINGRRRSSVRRQLAFPTTNGPEVQLSPDNPLISERYRRLTRPILGAGQILAESCHSTEIVLRFSFA